MWFASALNAQNRLKPQWRWRNFTILELACRCQGRFCERAYWHDPAFLDALQALREQTGKPIMINSAHRCRQWNATVGGAPLSQHKRLAVDIALAGHDRQTLLSRSRALGFTGLGLARSFLHLDRRRVPAKWYYSGSERLWQT